MNDAHLHLLTNHVAVVGIPLVAVALAWGLARRHDAVVRLALVGTLVMGGATWFANWSGGRAEEVVEDTVWASHDRIEDHEELGERAQWAALITAAAALGVVVFSRGGPAKRGGSLLVLVGLVVGGVLVGVAAFDGGKIRHDEVHGVAPDAGQEQRRTP